MEIVLDHTLIDASEGSAFSITRPDGESGIVLVCEHASNRMPRSIGDLGLDEAALQSHIAWDIGAAGVAEILSDTLDAVLVRQCFSRLVYDCNRPPEAPDAFPEKSEVFTVPGNAGLSEADRARRTDELYHPFHDAIDQVIDKHVAAGRDVVLVTVHSFTPVYFGSRRDGELGILHDADRRLADAMLEAAGEAELAGVRRNYPYGPEDGVTHTLKRHGLARGIPNVMLEIRNDLISGELEQSEWGVRIAGLIMSGLAGLKASEARA
ncbi:N-formylglutamate amidohydrolase [Hoeflea sp.]|uniref:N-formylglutamate amidohydrolase n=1 Tax=Hoeflea sp. TaxID=1940281 RepID=UPI003B51E537